MARSLHLPDRMTPERWDRHVACVDCDRMFDTYEEPVFFIDDDGGLCLECARRRDVRHEGFAERGIRI